MIVFTCVLETFESRKSRTRKAQLHEDVKAAACASRSCAFTAVSTKLCGLSTKHLETECMLAYA
jgi:hypothetical protein